MNRISNFEFVLPTRIVYGKGSIEKLPDEIRKMNHKKPLIVTDKGLIAAGIAKKITDILEQSNIEYAVFDGIQPNPRDTTVMKAAQFARDNAYCHRRRKFN